MHEVSWEISFYTYLGDALVNQVRLKTMRILLADDEPRVCSAIWLLLEQQLESNIVDEVSNAHEVLDYVRNCCPDILLLDWELLGSTPEKLLGILRALCPGLFLLVLYSNPQTRRASLKAGASEFVSKNDTPESLLAAIRSRRDVNN